MSGPRVVIGLEVHVRLATRTKLFCPCPVTFGAPPNSAVCPVCLGLPGALPVLNGAAVSLGIRAGVALGGRIAPRVAFDRKHYRYPDLPKGFQITQHRAPLVAGGEVAGAPVRHAHLEEDSGTSRHDGDVTLVDLNRAGAPLLEIVTEPAIGSARVAADLVRELREILVFAGVTDGDMEKGHLRAEPNVNLVFPDGRASPVVEVKNLNSLTGMAAAIDFEIGRQTGRGPRDGPRETRGWDEAREATVLERKKEAAHDYRYLPEPDLPPVAVDPATVERARRDLPEPPSVLRERWISRHGLSPADAAALTSDPETTAYFRTAAGAAGKGHLPAVATFVLGDVRRLANEGGDPPPPEATGGLVRLVEEGRLSREAARAEVWPALVAGATDPAAVVEERGLAGDVDARRLGAIVAAAVADAPGAVAAYRAGKEDALGPIVGEVLRQVRGRADGATVARLVRGAAAAPETGPRDGPGKMAE